MAERKQSTDIEIVPIQTESAELYLLGKTPIILNRMSEKAQHTLLLPGRPMNAAEKATNLKHDPLAEFRASPYTSAEPEAPTYLAALAVWFKKIIAQAALDIPGATKSQIGRLCWVEGERVPLYGEPQVLMAVTRSADINKTPDIRTRAIVPRWACIITVSWVTPLLNLQAIVNLLSAGGITNGAGDWRQQKGSGNYGQFTLVNGDDPALRAIIETGGRERQERAMLEPAFYDDESQSLYAWYSDETSRRGNKNVA